LHPADAIRTVTSNPAESLNLQNRLGLLAPGRMADLVAWDAQLRVRRVWKSGQEVSPLSNIAEVRIEKQIDLLRS
jgi:N-acetylglucosamine-6-phosphate deacetylase